MKKKLFMFIILLMIFVESFQVANAGTICCYYEYITQTCSQLKSSGSCVCWGGNTCPDTDVKSCGSCTCTPGTTTSCDYCSGSKKCVGGSQTCESWTSWGSCTGGSCSCVAGQCGAQCAPAGTESICSTWCSNHHYYVSKKTCQSDCTWSSCVTTDYGCSDTCGAVCDSGETRSCSYCSSQTCPQGGYKYCTGGTQTCQSDCTWGSCTGGSCSCVAGQCGVPVTTTTTKPSTTTTTLPSISLSLSPNPAGSSPIVATISASANYYHGDTVKVYWHTERGDIYECSCTVTSFGSCGCTFDTPNTPGTYTYRATLDINGDGIYDIYSDATLTVKTTRCPPPSQNTAYSLKIQIYCEDGNWHDANCPRGTVCDNGECKCIPTSGPDANKDWCRNYCKYGDFDTPKCIGWSESIWDYPNTLNIRPSGCSRTDYTVTQACGAESIGDCCSQCNVVGQNFTYDEKDKTCIPQGTYGGFTCCQYDSDCPVKDNVKGKCDSPSGTDNPDTSGYTYTCYWPKCKKNEDCVDNSCCVADPNGPDPTQGICVSQGIYSANPKYLCDPPEWHVDTQTKTQNILESIFNFFFHFFQR